MLKINLTKKLKNIKVSLHDFESSYTHDLTTIKRHTITKSKDKQTTYNKFKLIDIKNKNLNIIDIINESCRDNKYLHDYLKSVLPYPFNSKIEQTKAIKLLFTAKPLELEAISEACKKMPNNHANKQATSLIKDIFNYDKIRRKAILPSFLKLNLSTCFYCNRNYIGKFLKNNNLTSSVSLDHYYQKEKFPILSLSLYNLIPSCDTCNSRLKGSNDVEQYKNPYDEKYDFNEKAKFEITSPNSFKLSSKNAKCLQYINDFYINEIYHLHDNEFLSLIEKHKTYNEDIINKRRC